MKTVIALLLIIATYLVAAAAYSLLPPVVASVVGFLGSVFLGYEAVSLIKEWLRE